MSESKKDMICFILVLPIVIGFIVCEVVLLAFSDTLFFESETVITYNNLTSRDKQLTIAGRIYNLDEDITTTVTETVCRYTLKGSSSNDNNDIYMSKIQYASSDGTKKESTSIVKDKEDIRNGRLTPAIIVNTLLVTACIALEALQLRAYRIEKNLYW